MLEKKTQDCAGLASGRALADGFKNRKEYFCTFSLFYHSEIYTINNY